MREERGYFLRIWKDDNTKKALWRASLRDVGSQEVKYFKTSKSLCQFLQDDFPSDPEGNPADKDGCLSLKGEIT